VIEIVERAPLEAPATLHLSLPFVDRQRSRLRVVLEGGEVAALLLPRGTFLRGGDKLRTACGQVVEVRAAPERVSVAETPDSLLRTRAAYHLGNRHVPVEVRPEGLLYLHDHVLDDMVRGLGLSLRVAEEPFEPEGGAYSARGGAHSHGEHSHGGHMHSHAEHGHGLVNVRVHGKGLAGD
jgi:urease accessory protein